MQLVNTYQKRNQLTQILEDHLNVLFDSNEVFLIPFGVENIYGNQELLKYIKQPESNLSYSGMLVKFLPDYILLTKNSPQKLYFIELKTSITPLWAKSILGEIENKHNRYMNISDIGVIAREAWNAYNKYFPETIILEACSYNPKILMAQFVKDIKCLRCFKEKGKEGYDCKECPLKKVGFFENVRNYNSEGSQTPQTNIDYSSFEDIKTFFSKINISIKDEGIKSLKNIFMQKGVNFSSKTFEQVKENIINKLIKEGCNWLKK